MVILCGPPMKKILLTSVCRPLGEGYGDGPSVGYELLFGQVTRAQGLFSPRANHIQFSLEYVAENIEAPTTVLQYPSKRELVRELDKGYDVVGISFVLATFHRMKEVVALVREHCPGAEIVLGGYGTVLSDDVLLAHGDHVCREEGVAFMRRLLGEAEPDRPYRHPLVVSRLKLFGTETSRTGMIFAGLGCPNGCDFCCTSYFFKRRHIKLLSTGRDIYNVAMRYQELESEMGLVVLDEDFLLNRKRALEFRDCVVEGGVALSMFAFASVRALSQYKVEDLVEMGIDGLWIGYEGTESGYAKQDGRDVGELFRELRGHGISVLASMIVGFPYQTPEVIERELTGLLALEPGLSQFLIYGPTPGTPFYQRVMDEGLLDPELAADNERYYHSCTGFNAMVKHPSMSAEAIEQAQRDCFREDYHRLGPSIFRILATQLEGYLTLRDSARPMLRRKAELLARRLRPAYAVFLAGRAFAPNSAIRRRLADLEGRLHGALGRPSLAERVKSVAVVGLAALTGLRLKLDIGQHPKLTRHTFRLPQEAVPARIWRRLRGEDPGGHSVQVEQRPERTIWVHVSGSLRAAGAERLAEHLGRALSQRRERIVLDLENLVALEADAAEQLWRQLEEYRDRIRVAWPAALDVAAPALALAVPFSPYE